MAENCINNNNRLPYQPPAVTKRGNIKMLTQGMGASTILFQQDITFDNLDDTFVDTNDDGLTDYVRVTQTGGTQVGQAVNYPLSFISTIGSTRGYDSTPEEVSTQTDLVIAFNASGNDNSVPLGGIVNTTLWDNRDGVPGQT